MMYRLYEYYHGTDLYCYAVANDTRIRYVTYNDTIQVALDKLNGGMGVKYHPKTISNTHIQICTFNSIEELKETHPEVFI